MKYYLFLCLCIFSSLCLNAQQNETAGDSSSLELLEPRLYLICQSSMPLMRHGILPEGSLIRVTINHERKTGRLHIIGPDSISLRNEDGEKDTILLSSIRKITTSSASQKITGATLITIGWSGLIVSGVLMATPVVDNLTMLKVLGGMALFAVSLPIEIIGMRLRMKRYKSWNYHYRILSSEKADFSRKDLRALLKNG